MALLISSDAANAIIRALSVVISFSGKTSLKAYSSDAFLKASLKYEFADTPPETDTILTFNSLAALTVFSISTSIDAFWKEAAISIT